MSKEKAGQEPVLDTHGSVLPPPPEPTSARSYDTEQSASTQTTSYAKVVFDEPEEGTPAALALAANAQIKVSKTDKFLSKIRGMKRPKFKSLNLVKQLKKHTKTQRKAHKNFKGKVIDGQHELYVITAGIMLGIKCSLTHAKEANEADELITLDAFNYVEKASFPACGSDDPAEPYPTPPHSLVRTFKFKTYAPRIFARLRSLCDVSTEAYMEAICGNYNFLEFISNSKSGQFFFYSHDGKYMLKTQTKEENKFMKCILPHYYRYLAENPHTLIVRFLGMHRIKMYHFRRKVHFVIMTSVFDTPEQIHTIYDLKGSLIGREATLKEKEGGGVLKDLDLLERTASGDKIKLGEKKKAFLEQLDKDVKFLATLGIMDYSLLLGVHFRDRRPPVESQPAVVVPVGGAAAAGSPDGRTVAGTIDSPPRRPSSSSFTKGYAAGHSHSDTPLRRAQFAAEREKEAKDDVEIERLLKAASGSASAGSSGQGSGSANAEPPLTSEVVIQGGTAKESKSAYLMTPVRETAKISSNGASDVSESESASDMESMTSSMADADADSDDSDGGSVQVDLETNYANDDGSATALLLNKRIAYSDTNGLKYPEGNRLSLILSTKTKKSSPVNSPETANRKVNQTTKKKSSARGGDAIMSLEVDEPEPITTRQRAESTQILAFGHHPWTARPDGGINSRNSDGTRGNEIYYCGIIDILQAYDMRKQSESLLKGLFQDRKKISSVNPDAYARRFTEFMDANIE